jgi:hypothetical protein
MEPRPRAISFEELKRRKHSAGKIGSEAPRDGVQHHVETTSVEEARATTSSHVVTPPPAPPQQQLGLLKRRLKAREQNHHHHQLQKKALAAAVNIQRWYRMVSASKLQVAHDGSRQQQPRWWRELLVAIVCGWRVRRLFRCTRVDALRKQVVHTFSTYAPSRVDP